MKRTHAYLTALAGLGLVAAAACSRDMAPTAAGLVRADVAVHSATASPAGAAAADSTLQADHNDHGRWPWFFGRLRRSDVDSLTVDVTKAEVLAVTPDTEDAADSAAEAMADSGRRGDHDDDHENDERTWVSLDVTAGGHLDLLHLPDSAAAGLTIATGTLPAGRYKHVRLFATNGLIYLNTRIVTPAGDTLPAGVGLPVIIPSCDSTGATIKTDERFTVAAGSTTVQLYFDGDDTVRHIVLTGDGKIIVPPVVR